MKRKFVELETILDSNRTPDDIWAKDCLLPLTEGLSWTIGSNASSSLVSMFLDSHSGYAAQNCNIVKLLTNQKYILTFVVEKALDHKFNNRLRIPTALLFLFSQQTQVYQFQYLPHVPTRVAWPSQFGRAINKSVKLANQVEFCRACYMNSISKSGNRIAIQSTTSRAVPQIHLFSCIPVSL